MFTKNMSRKIRLQMETSQVQPKEAVEITTLIPPWQEVLRLDSSATGLAPHEWKRYAEGFHKDTPALYLVFASEQTKGPRADNGLAQNRHRSRLHRKLGKCNSNIHVGRHKYTFGITAEGMYWLELVNCSRQRWPENCHGNPLGFLNKEMYSKILDGKQRIPWLEVSTISDLKGCFQLMFPTERLPSLLFWIGYFPCTFWFSQREQNGFYRLSKMWMFIYSEVPIQMFMFWLEMDRSGWDYSSC